MARQKKFEIVDGPSLQKLIDAMWEGEGKDIRHVTFTLKGWLSPEEKKRLATNAYEAPATVWGIRRLNGSTEEWMVWGGCKGILPEDTNGDATLQPFITYEARYSTRKRTGELEPSHYWI
ncbi:MAG: hypothetical protein Q8R36_02230 [bacterium]|nr:hypothetical protein [bacterium]